MSNDPHRGVRVKRRTHRQHWTEVGRSLLEGSRELDRPGRAAMVLEAAGRLELSAHTVRRYMVLADFLGRINMPRGSADRMGVGQMEVLLRVWAIDPDAASSGLRAMSEGRLSYRQALRLEARARERAAAGRSGRDRASEMVRPDPGAPTSAGATVMAWLRKWSWTEATEIDLIGDERFEIVQVHRAIRLPQGDLAFIDEGAVSPGPSNVDFHALRRSIFVAVAVFDRLVVQVAMQSSREPLRASVRLCPATVADRILLDETRFEQRDDDEPVEA